MNQNYTPENKTTLLSAQYDDFLDALELLYIKDNMSGRIKFNENWPAAANYILGEELISMDENGTNDFERRNRLEDQAEDKRLSLLTITTEIESKSIDKGTLQTEYVETTIKQLGRDLALNIYDATIIDRFITPPIETTPQEPPSKEELKALSEELVMRESHSFSPAPKEPEKQAVPIVPVIPVIGEEEGDKDTPEQEQQPEPKTVSGTLTFIPSKKPET